MSKALYAVVLCCLTAGCAGPHSSGSLWAQQNLEREAALFKLGDAQRAEQATAFELSLADEALAAERARITAELRGCPGPRQPLTVSPGDKVRDGIRVRAQGDSTRLAQVAQLAMADWQVRRAGATGRSELCDAAGGTLQGMNLSAPGSSQSQGLLRSSADGVVTRDPRQTTAPIDTQPPTVTVSNYALGYSEVVHAASPLPEYLAYVYGGYLNLDGGGSGLDEATAAERVDLEASAYPEWEPDALYAAFRAGSG